MSGFGIGFQPPHAGLASGDYVAPMGCGNAGSKTLSTSAQVHAFPFYFPRGVTLQTLAQYLVTAQTGAAMRAGLYDNLNGRPNALLSDLGEVSFATGSGSDRTWSPTISVAGWIWVLLWNKDVATAVTVMGVNQYTGGFVPAYATAVSAAFNPPFMSLQSAYPGAMPSTAPAVVPGLTTNVPFPLLRLA